MPKAIDITGQRYGRLVAIKPTNERTHKKIIWLLKCDCGNEIAACVGNARKGTTKSCGCLRREKQKAVGAATGEQNAIDITNQRFGRLTAIKPTEERTRSGNAKWAFKCDCGNEKR